jgi:hypothetical protein
MKNMKTDRSLKKNSTGLFREISAIALALMITPMVLAGATRVCKAITQGTQNFAACALLPGGYNCAAPNYVCGVKRMRRTCFDGGVENCSEGFLGFFGNCTGTYDVNMLCTYVNGWPSYEGVCVCR